MIEIHAKEWMPPGFVGFSMKGEGPLDTHYFMLTDTGNVIDLGRPRDLFPLRPLWQHVDGTPEPRYRVAFE